MLYQKFSTALNAARSVAANSYLTHLSEAVKAVENALPQQPALQGYVTDLANLLDKPNFALNPTLTNKFAQLLGEAHFSVLCHLKGLRLRRIPEEKDKKTPDFETAVSTETFFFEVKTLSVVGGDTGINDALESSLQAQLDIEAQLLKGEKVAIGISEAQPYGVKPYQQGRLSAVINTLIEKSRQNIKADQFASPNTFLVLNLSVITPSKTENFVLRPSYPDNYMFSKAVTGELWTLAFGQPQMLIQNTPEFEGKPCVEGLLTKLGILVDPDFDFVAGLVFMIHPWHRPSEIWALFRNRDWEKWNDDNSEMLSTLFALTGENWNDDKDNNGWRLSGGKWGDTQEARD